MQTVAWTGSTRPRPNGPDQEKSCIAATATRSHAATELGNLLALKPFLVPCPTLRVFGDLISYRKDGNSSAATAGQAGSVSVHSA
jgi:hypothetical protein